MTAEPGNEPTLEISAEDLKGYPITIKKQGIPIACEEPLTNKEYAAIHLSVPDSGTEWLDEMIRKKNRREIAAMALQTLDIQAHVGIPAAQHLAKSAVALADALLVELEKGEK